MFIHNMIMGSKNGIMDIFHGAVAAYSMRALTANAGTPIVRVIRDSDNAQQDFRSTLAGDLDTALILAFVGVGGEGRVVTWYDQSGNGHHVTQATHANRPLIVVSGLMVETNGLPAIDFIDGTITSLRNTNFSMNTNPHTVFTVVDYSNVDSVFRRYMSIQRAVLTEGSWIYGAKTGVGLSGSGNPRRVIANSQIPANSGVSYYIADSANHHALAMGGQFLFEQSGTLVHADMQQIRLGKGDSDNIDEVWQGTMQEVIVYPQDRSAYRTGIEQNQTTYYNL